MAERGGGFGEGIGGGSGDDFGDAITAPFWAAARERRLVLQRCARCGAHQFYPRPFCLACDAGAQNLTWTPAAGGAVVLSQTTVRIQVIPDLEPPYRVAVVELDEGPRITTNLVGAACAIGDRVRLAWRERRDPLPPLPVFEPERDEEEDGVGTT